ncbi:MAG: hypothetical protein J7L96_08080 [Bacteroidales bacterium]|nr:hypothetical protein [Bacteroidales bacterium]
MEGGGGRVMPFVTPFRDAFRDVVVVALLSAFNTLLLADNFCKFIVSDLFKLLLILVSYENCIHNKEILQHYPDFSAFHAINGTEGYKITA